MFNSLRKPIPHLMVNGNSSEDALISDDEPSHEDHPNFKMPNFMNQKALPAFKKRPLSDTPFVSNHNSPVLAAVYDSNSASPMGMLSENDEDIPDIPVLKEGSKLKDMVLRSPEAQKSFGVTNNKKPPKRRATTLDVPGLTKSKSSPDGTIASLDIGSKLVIVMVGLPARGKSYITNKLARYLNWSQHECKVFNVGNTRRKTDTNNLGPSLKPLPDVPSKNNSQNSSYTDVSAVPEDHTLHDSTFFSPENKSYVKIREKWAMDTLDLLLDYIIDGSGSVGIFDATNTTRLRRQKIINQINRRSAGQLKILFLESLCDEPKLIEQNIRLKLSGPDYRDTDPEVALKDFSGRLYNYEKVYETIGDYEEKTYPEIQYVKMINVGKKIVSYNIQGFLASQTIYFLLNFNLKERLICITRHGESADNVLGKIGGDSELTRRGKKFADTLARFISSQKEEFRKRQLETLKNKLKIEYNRKEEQAVLEILDKPPTEPTFCVWTSMLKRSIQTAQYFNENEFFVKEMRMLDELGAGKMEGMTYPQIQQKYPQEYEARVQDKLRYRYPGLGGESYLDVINRLKPIISEIERSEDHLLLITHRVVSRILLGYFLNIDKAFIGDLDIPLHSLYILEPKTYGVDWSLYEYSESRDWFYKVDKFKYTKKLKDISIGNNGKRKYSVVPSLPNYKEQVHSQHEDHTNSIASNLHRLRNIPQSSSGAATSPNADNFEVGELTEKLARLKQLRDKPNTEA